MGRCLQQVRPLITQGGTAENGGKTRAVDGGGEGRIEEPVHISLMMSLVNQMPLMNEGEEEEGADGTRQRERCHGGRRWGEGWNKYNTEGMKEDGG